MSKIAGRYERNPTQKELKKSIDDTSSIVGGNCIGNALDFLLKVEGEEREIKNKVVQYNLQMHTPNGSGFDTWIVLNNPLCDKHIADIIKNGNGNIELKVFNGYISKKQITQYLHFRCGMTHLFYSLRKNSKEF